MKRQDNSGRRKRDGYNLIAQPAGLLSEVNSRSSFFPLSSRPLSITPNSHRASWSSPQSFSSALPCFLFPPQSCTSLCHCLLSSYSAHKISSYLNCSRKPSLTFQSIITIFLGFPSSPWLACIHDYSNCCLELASCLQLWLLAQNLSLKTRGRKW